MMYCPKRNRKPRKYEEKLLGSGCQGITNYTSAPILGHIYFVYIQKHQRCYSKNCMKEFVGAIQEEDHWHTEPSLKGTGGRACRKRPKNMSRSATNARDLPQISTNREESLTLFPVLGHSLNGIWILSALSRKQQETNDI